MAYKRHLRLTMSGTIATAAEQFSMSLSLVPDHSGVADFLTTFTELGYTQYLIDHVGPSHFADIVNDCSTYFHSAPTNLSDLAVLKRVKLAAIKEDGRYAGAPMEAAVNVQGINGNHASVHPWQISQKVTLETDGDLGRVKGGFYLPLPTMLYDATSDLWAASDVADLSDSTQTFLNSLNDVPGLDVDSYKVVVASQGRHNLDGSVRVAPENHVVKRIHMGRRPDVIRRRANQVLEARVVARSVT